MGKNSKPDLTEDRLFTLGWGLVYRAVCAPKSWTPDKVAETITKDDPPGTSLNAWFISEPDEDREDDFKGVNCIPCPDCADRQHWLLNC